ncbi:MAG: dTDP-4-dehydrorhamnose 3,5-epimerase [bacterium]|nr:dTDP-4-dehydrorhamnose 3,5-epimerase [bacterium]
MRFSETNIPGVWVVEIEYTEDERGFFARTWDEQICGDQGLRPSHMVQYSTSLNHTRGTIRGMHFQKSPHTEAKVVRCTRGAMYDVAVDLRPESPTYTKWIAIELTADNRRSLYIPEGCAHGFQTLTDATEVLYMMSAYFNPEASRGVRYNDHVFNIEWPHIPSFISEKDSAWPDWPR